MRCALLLVVVFGGPPAANPARGDVIGVGLNWRAEVFVQEVWEGGEPFYLLFSRREKPVKLTVHSYRGGEKLAGPWSLPPKRLVRVKAAGLIGKDLISLRLDDGVNLGLLESPVKGAWGKDDAKRLVSHYGLNGSGGRQKDIWVTHPALSVEPGTTFSIDVSIPSKSGAYLWSKQKNEIASVTCPSLDVLEFPDRFEVDTGKGKGAVSRHVVTIKLRAPKEKSPALIILGGWRWTVPKKSGHGLTRGIVVVPTAP